MVVLVPELAEAVAVTVPTNRIPDRATATVAPTIG